MLIDVSKLNIPDPMSGWYPKEFCLVGSEDCLYSCDRPAGHTGRHAEISMDRFTAVWE